MVRMSRVSARPTRSDVARLANVSTATVSYVLNDAPGQRISAQTREAVHAAAAALGYRPNLAARNLAVGGSGVVLYVMPRMALGPLPMEVGSRLTTALARRGIVLSLQLETDDGDNVVDAIADLHPTAVTSVFPLTGKALAAARDAGIPQIHLGSAQLAALGTLNCEAGVMWVDHLVARGHRQLVFVYTDDMPLRALGDYWLDGVRAALAGRGLPDPVIDTVRADGSDAAARVRNWVDAGVTAVCAQSDEVAFVVLHGIRTTGLACPQDLAVLGVDANPLGAVSAPPLTSIGFDAGAIVDVAVAAILAELGYSSQDTTPQGRVARLIERAST